MTGCSYTGSAGGGVLTEIAMLTEANETVGRETAAAAARTIVRIVFREGIVCTSGLWPRQNETALPKKIKPLERVMRQARQGTPDVETRLRRRSFTLTPKSAIRLQLKLQLDPQPFAIHV